MAHTKEQVKKMLIEMLEHEGKEVFLDFISESLVNLETRVEKLEEKCNS